MDAHNKKSGRLRRRGIELKIKRTAPKIAGFICYLKFQSGY